MMLFIYPDMYYNNYGNIKKNVYYIKWLMGKLKQNKLKLLIVAFLCLWLHCDKWKVSFVWICLIPDKKHGTTEITSKPKGS